MPRDTNPDYLNGVPELLILELLSHRPMHGYELLRAIARASHQVLEFGEGCIYPILHRLEADGHLASRREIVDGRSRVVYRITTRGRKRLVGRRAAWKTIITAVNQVLQEAEHGKPAVA